MNTDPATHNIARPSAWRDGAIVGCLTVTLLLSSSSNTTDNWEPRDFATGIAVEDSMPQSLAPPTAAELAISNTIEVSTPVDVPALLTEASAPVQITSSEASTVSVAPEPVPTEQAPVAPSPEILPALPRHASIPAIGLEAPMAGVASSYDESGTWVIEPPGGNEENRVKMYWWNELEYSKMPSTLAEGTVSLYAHKCYDLSYCAGNQIDKLQVGDEMTIITDNGPVVYVLIHDVLNLHKSAEGIGSDQLLTELQKPGTATVYACAYNKGTSVSEHNSAAVFLLKNLF